MGFLRKIRPFLLMAVALGLGLVACNRNGGSGGRPVPGLTGRVQLGIDVLEQDGFAPLRGRRVGLVTNHTGVNGRGELTRVAMQRALGPGLVALYAPEHGLFGKVGAGENIAGSVDPITRLRVFSLYGGDRKPSPAMLGAWMCWSSISRTSGRGATPTSARW